MVDKKLSEFSEVSTGGVSYFPILDNNTKNGKLAAAKAMRWSNCITEIPQDIKLELSNGTLTLKSGSVITLPNGNQFTTTSDLSNSSAARSGKKVVFCTASGSGIHNVPIENCCSGSTDTLSGVSYHIWFDTTNLEVKYYGSGGGQQENRALPLCIVNAENTTITSIDQVFNGVGYIGTSIFVLPFVSGLAPNGFNSDGTLASYNITISALAFYNNTETNVTNSVLVRAQSGGFGRGQWTESETLATSGRTYIPSKNRVYTSNGNEQSCFRVCRYSASNGVITDFEVMPVIRMATKQDLDGCVKTTGDQAISGAKTFSDMLRLRASFGSPIAWRLDDTNNKGAIYSMAYYNASSVYHRMLAENTTSSKSVHLDVKAKDDGTGEINLGGTATLVNNNATSSKNSGLIATIGFVNDPAKSTNVVHRDGNEEITGNKTFTGTNTVPTPATTDNSQQIANTAWVCANASFGSTPRDITELADFNDTLAQNGNLNLSESWQNFQELVFIGSSVVNKGGTNVAFRISTYWLDYMLSHGYGCVVWAGYINAHLDVASYTAANPSTSNDLYVNSHAYCYLGKIYGVNRKAGS